MSREAAGGALCGLCFFPLLWLMIHVVAWVYS